MERSKLGISIVVGILAVLIIWRVGFYPPVPGQTEKPTETKEVVATELQESEEVQKPSDANEPKVASEVSEPRQLTDVNEPRTVATVSDSTRLAADAMPRRAVIIAEPNEPVEPNEPMENLNLKTSR